MVKYSTAIAIIALTAQLERANAFPTHHGNMKGSTGATFASGIIHQHIHKKGQNMRLHLSTQSQPQPGDKSWYNSDGVQPWKNNYMEQQQSNSDETENADEEEKNSQEEEEEDESLLYPKSKRRAAAEASLAASSPNPEILIPANANIVQDIELTNKQSVTFDIRLPLAADAESAWGMSLRQAKGGYLSDLALDIDMDSTSQVLYRDMSAGSAMKEENKVGAFDVDSNFSGVIITDVVPGGKAAEIGLKVGDILVGTSATMGEVRVFFFCSNFLSCQVRLSNHHLVLLIVILFVKCTTTTANMAKEHIGWDQICHKLAQSHVLIHDAPSETIPGTHCIIGSSRNV